jgi:predicted RNA-binding protein YlxR (DUF448 family)
VNAQPGRSKHVPVRMCVVCRDKDSKRALTRIVRTPEGVRVDASGKLNGRGAYLCEQASCWERAAQSDVLNRALRTTLSVEDREYLQHAKPTP